MLITLAIIGIIAALTVPTLMRKYQEHQTVVAVKDAYSVLGNALKMAVAEHGPSSTWDIGEAGYSTASHIKAMNYFIPYLKLADYDSKNCHTDYNEGIKTLNGVGSYGSGTQAINKNCIKLQNGTVLFIQSTGASSKQIVITVDINGKNPPNALGRDVFIFRFKDNNLLPQGVDDSNRCKTNNTDSYGCAYWVIYKGNMDYLRRDVTAEW